MRPMMAPAAPAALRLDVLDGNVAVLTIDQPGGRANTLGQAVIAELGAMAAHLATRSFEGLVFVSGKPGMFIAGADLKELGSARHDPAQTSTFVQRGLGVIAAYENLPYPTVACIDGACMGG